MVDKLYTQYFGELVNYVSALCKDRNEAQDIVQETFIRALHNLELLSGLNNRQCRAWLYKTSRNIFTDNVRRKAKAPLPEDCELSDDDLSVFSVSELIRKLPDDEARIFSLRYFSGYNSSEIGRLMKLPPGTIRSKLSSARKKLRLLYDSE